MKIKFLKSKSFYATIGSISAISGIGYFSQTFLSKYGVFNKIPIKSKYFDENKDYIYLNEELTDMSSYEISEEGITGGIGGNNSKSIGINLHLLLRLAQYKRDKNITDFAIKSIAKTQLNESQCREFAQMCDFKTSVRLAMISNVNLKLFLPPIKTDFIKINSNKTKKPNIYFDFEKVLQNMLRETITSDNKCSECTKYFTEMSIKLLNIDKHSKQLHQTIDYNDIHNAGGLIVPEVDWICLEAITQNVLCGKNQCKILVDNGLFLVLHYLREKFSDLKVQVWVAQTLANLSVHKEIHLHFWYTRWLGVLAQWLQSTHLELSLSAAKILHNLSEDSEKYLIPESLYLMHPIFYDNSNKMFDIIFVHGLLGGAFKTWRQCDSEKQVQTYTQCWPQKWLASDIDNIRVLAVNYQTFLSHWNIECQDSSNAFTLKQRSSQLLSQLISSKVGQKPIIWVTHSMGGLLVKQMLVDIIENNDLETKSILNQTKGIVFYSVPHRGSEMAVWSPGIQRIIYPSSEILELRKDSKLLLSLHNQFLKLIEQKPIKCLSFGETLKSTVIKRPFQWKYLLVPEDSSNPGIGEFHLLDVDHFNSCKPKDKTSEAYYLTTNFIKSIIESNSDIDKEKNDKILILIQTIFS